MSITLPILSSCSSGDSSAGSPLSSPPLFNLVKKSRWKRLKKSILLAHRSAGKKKQKKHRGPCEDKDETGLNLLGLALGYHAPLEIIQTVLSVDPDQCRTVDIYGANSLHLACLNGASPDSVACIVNHCKDLVDSRDLDQRTPLHHAVECICHDEIEFKPWSMIVDTLCLHECSIIHDTDHNDNSPLDIVHIAINYIGASPDIEESKRLAELKRLERVLRHLRRVSIEVYRLKKKQWESCNRPASDVSRGSRPGVRKMKRRGNKMPSIMQCVLRSVSDEERVQDEIAKVSQAQGTSEMMADQLPIEQNNLITADE